LSPLLGGRIEIPFQSNLTEVFVGDDLENSSETVLSCKNGLILIAYIGEFFVLDIFEVFNGKPLKFVKRLLSH
jgi:hypothetical protein